MADDVTRIGSITKEDPMLRYTAAGKAVLNFGIKVQPWAPKDEEKPEAVFYKVTCWEKLAEHVAETLRRGDKVIVVGTPKVDSYTGKDGKEYTDKVITAHAVGVELSWVSAEIHRSEGKAPRDPELERPF